MEKFKAFLKRKNIEISAKRYGIDALGAMAQGLFASLLVGTILSTLGTQLGIEALVSCGGYASAMSGAAMAVAIGYSLQAPWPFSLSRSSRRNSAKQFPKKPKWIFWSPLL